MSEAALAGDLAHFFPSEVLQLLQLAQSTGRLEIMRGGERVEFEIETGRPIFARTTGQSVRTGEVLLHRGQVTQAALDAAFARQRATPRRRLATLLVEAGAITPEQAREAVLEVLRRIVWGVLLWRTGTFRFVPGRAGEPEEVPLDVDLDRLILEGLRLADQARAASGES